MFFYLLELGISFLDLLLFFSCESFIILGDVGFSYWNGREILMTVMTEYVGISEMRLKVLVDCLS